ncbi:MAG: ribonuclease P protein component [Acidobacteriota bacterium]|nr:ribonuclease P protein component [Acidobacteriota bacterium]
MSDTPKGSFPKTAHLLKHSDFQKVYEQGRRHFSGNMTVFFLRRTAAATAVATGAPAESGVRIGFTVSRALGKAVDRNRMRRRTREAVRHHLSMLDGMSEAVDVVINPKKSLLVVEFSQISQEIERAFRVVRQGQGEAARPRGEGRSSRRGKPEVRS